MRIFVVGFMGSDRASVARTIAQEKGYTFHHMDEEIAAEDGRSLLRICMLMGEHEYRNKEYAMLSNYLTMEDIVVACGDGVVLDDECRRLLRSGQVIVVDEEPEALWTRAKDDDTIPYAFLRCENENIRKALFLDLYHRRKPLYDSLK